MDTTFVFALLGIEGNALPLRTLTILSTCYATVRKLTLSIFPIIARTFFVII